VEVTAAEGVGVVEAPRGVLFHHYSFDGDGRIDKANCVVPSTQNNGNIHRDLPALVDNAIARGIDDDRRLELVCSMLVRSYDPCLSCSVH
jgi:coenzyme F420-reducing hydrogenase alpha subunit